MIRVADSFLLARTKLNSRKIRLIITIIVAGLLFVGLFLASLIFNGAMKSVEKFGEDGFGKRYITRIDSSPFGDDFTLLSDSDLLADAKQADKNLVAAKTAEARRLGIDYDPKTEVLSVNDQAIGPIGKPMVQETPQSSPLIKAKRAEASKAFFEATAEVEKSYKTVGSYWIVSLTGMNYGAPSQNLDSTSMSIISGGKEDSEATGSSMMQPPSGLKSFSQGLNAASSGLLSAFLLPNQALSSGPGEPIAVIAPFSAAEEALGLAKLPQSSTTSARLERLKEVRTKAAGITFQVCLRNSTSLSRQSEAQSVAEQLERNKNNKEYIKPELIYAKSDKPCEDVVVSRDVRSADTKAIDLKKEQFDAKFGKQLAKQRIASFKIVGIAPDPPDFSGAFSVSSLISSLLVSNLGSGWFMPLESKDKIPEYSEIFDQIGKVNQFSVNKLFEFASADEARRFSKEKSCDLGTIFGDPAQAINGCKERGTPFFLSGFGSNSVALESAKKSFSVGFIRVALVVAAISVIITMGTIGKVIADSRRETAVFRAIGAKRLDIAQVYMTYALMLGIIVVVFAAGVAWLLASLAQSRYASSITIDALTAFNSTNLSRKFELVGIDFMQLASISVLVLAGALLSAVGPLVSNLKRNPIKDMRDER